MIIDQLVFMPLSSEFFAACRNRIEIGDVLRVVVVLYRVDAMPAICF